MRAVALLFPALLLRSRTRPTHAATILQTIEASPGIHYGGLRRDLRLGNGVLTHHLCVLERDRRIRRRRSGTHVRFYPTVVVPPETTLDANAARVLADAEVHPGTSQSDLARRLRTSRQLVHHHVRRLVGLGLLLVERDGRASRLHPAADAAGRRAACHRCGVEHVWPDAVPADARCPTCRRSLA